MAFVKKRLAKVLSCALAVLLVGVGVVLWQLSDDMLSPWRQPLQDYQREWLGQPRKFGITIHQAKCAQGQAPCLMVAPDAAAGPGERGQAIRQQLQNWAVSLKPYGESRGIVVILHGRNSRKEALLPAAERFAAAGFKSVLPDMPAHGDSPVPEMYFSTTEFEHQFANNVLADARTFFKDNHSPAVIWGYSMGGTYAIDAVTRQPGNWNAMVIVSSFDSLPGMMADRIKELPSLLIPAVYQGVASLLELRAGFDVTQVQPVQWVSTIKIPTLVVHGDSDQLIAFERGKRLFSALASVDKKFVTVPNAGHANILVTDFPIYTFMAKWLIDHGGK